MNRAFFSMHEKVKQSFEALRETLKIHKSLMKKISNVFFSKTHHLRFYNFPIHWYNSQIKKKTIIRNFYCFALFLFYIFRIETHFSVLIFPASNQKNSDYLNKNSSSFSFSFPLSFLFVRHAIFRMETHLFLGNASVVQSHDADARLIYRRIIFVGQESPSDQTSDSASVYIYGRRILLVGSLSPPSYFSLPRV